MNLGCHKIIIFGYPKMYFRISINRFLDILKYIFEFPKIDLWISENKCLDIQKSTYGYPNIQLIFGYLKIDLRISKNRGVF